MTLDRLRGWMTLANPYAVAVPLSLASAALGLAREVLILGKLGLSARNDELQYYLSVTFTISLFGDAVRLATANLAQRSSSTRVLVPVIGTASLVSLAAGAWFATHAQWDLPGAIAIAAVAGSLNLIAVSLIILRQRTGRFLPAHVVTVLPNVLILLGITAALGTESARFISIIVWLFLAAPIVQIIALLLMRPGTQTSDPPGEDRAPLSSRLRVLGPHGAGALGNQAGQAVLRTALALAHPGTLALYAFLARVVDSLRAMFLDSFIGSRLADWAAGRTNLPRWLHAGQFRPLLGGALVFLSVTGVLLAQGQPVGWRLGVGLGVILFTGAWFSFAVRMGLFAVNTSAIPPRLNWNIAGIDVASAVVVGVGWSLQPATVIPLLWLFTVVRPLSQLVLVRRELQP